MHISYKVAHKFVRIAIPALLLFMLTACGTGSSTGSTGRNNTTPASGGAKKSLSVATGKITEFPIITADSSKVDPLLIAITGGPDRNLWFTETSSSGSTNVGKIGKIEFRHE